VDQEIKTDPANSEKNEWLVFVSHAGTDTWIAKRIAEMIEANGGKTFLDEAHIDAGEDFEERILLALDDADELLVLLTPWSLKRPYVWAELGAAWSKRKPIIVVLYGLSPEELTTQASVPIFIKRRDLIDLNQFDVYLDQLNRRMVARPGKENDNG
jgi:hypothetical protein